MTLGFMTLRTWALWEQSRIVLGVLIVSYMCCLCLQLVRVCLYICTPADYTTVQYPAIAVFTVDMNQGFYDPWLRRQCE